MNEKGPIPEKKPPSGQEFFFPKEEKKPFEMFETNSFPEVVPPAEDPEETLKQKNTLKTQIQEDIKNTKTKPAFDTNIPDQDKSIYVREVGAQEKKKPWWKLF